MGRRIPTALWTFALACSLSIACSSAETSITSPTASGKCQVTATLSPASFDAQGGTGTIGVSTARDCTWSITTNAAWVGVTGARSGQGEAAVSYSVAPNPAPSPRSGSIVVSDRTLQLSQAGAPCRYALSRTQDSISAGDGSLSVSVSTTGGCAWTASSSSAWISITSGSTGNGPGTVSLRVAANTGPQRVGQVNVAGETYTVTQAAASGGNPGPPPPDDNNTVRISGTVYGVIGTCPDLLFGVGDYRVSTDQSTTYKGLVCGDVQKGGKDVTVTGAPQGGNLVQAEQIEKMKHD